MKALWVRLILWAKALKRDVLTLWFCARHPRTPLLAKFLALLLAAYAFSPIDLIPDFIPIIGFLDEVLLLPLGIALCLRLVPPAIIAECRAKATAWSEAERPIPRSYLAAASVIVLWIALLYLLFRWWTHR